MSNFFKVIFIALVSLLLVGCFSDNDLVDSFKDTVNNTDGYYIKGTLEIYNNEDKYTYNVETSYFEGDMFKVKLVNTLNNHEQIILRNNEGVYVLTPSLNKSFKFQSEWPYNSSQIYLLQTILKDMEDDTEKIIEEDEHGFIVTTKVNYTSNANLTKQKIYFDTNKELKSIEVLNDSDTIMMKMTFDTIDYKASYNTEYFALNNNVTDNQSESTSKIDTVIYPMFLPDNTTLTNQEKVSLDNGERVIMTFGGDNPFTIIQETVTVDNEFLTVPVSGNLEFVTGTIGTISESSVNWISNGLEFYVVSDVLTQDELLKVANSINTITVGK